MKRCWLSILILAAGLAFAAYVTGSGFLSLLELPGFIIAVVTPLLFVTILFGFKETCRAFTILRKKENKHDTLLTALAFFKAYGEATWISTVIAIFTVGIGILSNMEDKAAIGPNLALALSALIYCGVIQLAVVIPYTVLIHKQLGNSKIRGDMLSLFGSLFGVIFVFLLLFVIISF